jgi:hypothetical protein
MTKTIANVLKKQGYDLNNLKGFKTNQKSQWKDKGTHTEKRTSCSILRRNNSYER